MPGNRAVLAACARSATAAVVSVVVVSVVVVSVAVPGAGAASATSAGHGSRDDAPPAAGLEQTWTGTSGTWAVIAMGHYGQKLNTFWQVLFRPAGAARWTLVTPPGVASNGGFSAGGLSGASGIFVAGFQPTDLLRYSPIARTSDDGTRWSAGTLASGLLPVADGVAVAADGVVLALVRSDGGTLVRSDGSLTAWRPVVTRHALGSTGAGRRCGVQALTAVADASGSAASPELGAACAVAGVVGLFHRSSGRWVATTVRLHGDTSSTFAVLRLQRGASGTSALVEARRAGRASLVALWRSGASATWMASSSVRLHGAVLSTASTGGGSLLVVTGRRFRARDVLWVGGAGTPWRSLGPPPRGTQVVAAAPASDVGTLSALPASEVGTLSALAASGSTLTVWRREAGGTWHRTAQRLDVPIEYGSST